MRSGSDSARAGPANTIKMNNRTGLRVPIRRNFVITAITILLLMLWIPVVFDKVTKFANFKAEIIQQPLPDWFLGVLVYLLLFLEIATVLSLIPLRTRKMGYWLSFGLLLSFTAYVGLALLGVWGQVPCSCGSVISGMSWRQHFLFNGSFLILNAYGLIQIAKSNAHRQ